MADLMTQLAARTLQLAPVVQPRIDSVFAPREASVDWQSDSLVEAGSREVIREATPATVDRINHRSVSSPPVSRESVPPPPLVSPASAALAIAHIPRPIATPESTSESLPTSLSAPSPDEDLTSSPSLGIEPIEPLPTSVAFPSSLTYSSATTASISVPPSAPRVELEMPLTSPATLPPATPLTDSQTISSATSFPPPSAPSAPKLGPTHNSSPTVPPIVTPRSSAMTSIEQTSREEEASRSDHDIAPDQADRRSALPTPPSPSRLRPLVTATPIGASDPSPPLSPLVSLGAVPLARPRFEASNAASPDPVIDRPTPQSTGIPTINITIGRIDIRAVPAPSPSPTRRAAPTTPKISLQDYLNTRNGGGG